MGVFFSLLFSGQEGGQAGRHAWMHGWRMTDWLACDEALMAHHTRSIDASINQYIFCRIPVRNLVSLLCSSSPRYRHRSIIGGGELGLLINAADEHMEPGTHANGLRHRDKTSERASEHANESRNTAVYSSSEQSGYSPIKLCE